MARTVGAAPGASSGAAPTRSAAWAAAGAGAPGPAHRGRRTGVGVPGSAPWPPPPHPVAARRRRAWPHGPNRHPHKPPQASTRPLRSRRRGLAALCGPARTHSHHPPFSRRRHSAARNRPAPEVRPSVTFRPESARDSPAAGTGAFPSSAAPSRPAADTPCVRRPRGPRPPTYGRRSRSVRRVPVLFGAPGPWRGPEGRRAALEGGRTAVADRAEPPGSGRPRTPVGGPPDGPDDGHEHPPSHVSRHAHERVTNAVNPPPTSVAKRSESDARASAPHLYCRVRSAPVFRGRPNVTRGASEG